MTIGHQLSHEQPCKRSEEGRMVVLRMNMVSQCPKVGMDEWVWRSSEAVLGAGEYKHKKPLMTNGPSIEISCLALPLAQEQWHLQIWPSGCPHHGQGSSSVKTQTRNRWGLCQWMSTKALGVRENENCMCKGRKWRRDKQKKRNLSYVQWELYFHQKSGHLCGKVGKMKNIVEWLDRYVT